MDLSKAGLPNSIMKNGKPSDDGMFDSRFVIALPRFSHYDQRRLGARDE